MWDFIIASSLPPYYPKLMCCTDVSKTFPLVWKLWPKSIKYFTEPQWSSSRENVCESPGNYGASDFLQKPFNCLDSGQLGAPTYIDLFACSSASVECGHVAVLCPAPLTSCNQTLYLQWNEIWPLTTCHPRSQEDTPHHTQLSQGHEREIQINSENVMLACYLF